VQTTLLERSSEYYQHTTVQDSPKYSQLSTVNTGYRDGKENVQLPISNASIGLLYTKGKVQPMTGF